MAFNKSLFCSCCAADEWGPGILGVAVLFLFTDMLTPGITKYLYLLRLGEYVFSPRGWVSVTLCLWLLPLLNQVWIDPSKVL